MTPDSSPAEACSGLIAACVKAFETELSEHQEARMTIFLGGREISMRLSKITPSKAGGLIVFAGRDDEGQPIDCGVHYSAIAYMLQAADTKNAVRFGFGEDAPTP